MEARAARREAGGVEGAPRDASLTRLRFLLIAWVVLYHLDLTLRVSEALPWLRPVLGRGYLGVDGFFLLSGFALWLGYAGRPPQGRAGIGAFLLRRFAKVWPLHAVAMLALAALVAAAAVAGVAIRDPDRFRAEDFLLQLALVNAWETTDRHAWNYPSWALSAEWAGYLAFPWVLRGVLGLPHRAVPAAALLAGAGLLVLSRHVPLVGLNLTIHLGLARFGLEFVLGLLLGRLATEGRLPRARPLLLAGRTRWWRPGWRRPSPASRWPGGRGPPARAPLRRPARTPSCGSGRPPSASTCAGSSSSWRWSPCCAPRAPGRPAASP